MESTLGYISREVKVVKVSPVNTHLRYHNIIFSDSSLPFLKGTIDLEFIEHAPSPITIPTPIEPIFEIAPPQSVGLRQAFWNEIPDWKHQMKSNASRAFLDLYVFGLYLKADSLPDNNATLAAKEKHWEKNIKFVEEFLVDWEIVRALVCR